MHHMSRYLRIVIIILAMAIAVPFAGFGGNPPVDSQKVTSTGTIRKQGITTYMYGTHVLVDDGGKTLYALTSDRVDLDRHIGRKVTVKGDLVQGYPVDSGPNYLHVTSVE